MEIIIGRETVKVSEEHLNRIKERYHPNTYIKVIRKEHLIFIAYEKVFKGVDLYYSGYLLNLKSPSLSTFSRIKENREKLSFEDKINIIKLNLPSVDIKDKEEARKLLNGLFWLYDNTKEEVIF